MKINIFNKYFKKELFISYKLLELLSTLAYNSRV